MWMITPLQARRRLVDDHARHQDAALESRSPPSHTSAPLTTTTAGEARLHDQRSTRQVHAPLRLRGGHQVTLEQLLKSPRTGASPRPSTWRPPTENGSSRRARSSPCSLHPHGMRRPQAEPPPALPSCDRLRLELRRHGLPPAVGETFSLRVDGWPTLMAASARLLLALRLRSDSGGQGISHALRARGGGPTADDCAGLRDGRRVEPSTCRRTSRTVIIARGAPGDGGSHHGDATE